MKKEKSKNSKKNILIGLVSLFIYFYLQSLPATLLDSFHIDTDTLSSTFKFIYLGISEIIIILLLILVNYDTLKNNFIDLKKNHKKNFSSCIKYWLICLIIMMGSNLIISLISDSTIASNEETIRTMFKINPIYVYFSSVIFAPIVEEIVFRLSIRNIIKNNVLFILVSGFVFGGLHVISGISNWYDILYIIPYSAPGIAFAYMLVKTDNIYTSMGFHLMHNGILIGLQFIILIFGW